MPRSGTRSCTPFLVALAAACAPAPDSGKSVATDDTAPIDTVDSAAADSTLPEPPNVILSAVALDFGEVGTRCIAERELVILNRDAAAVILADVVLASASGEFELDGRRDDNGPLPWAMLSGTNRAVTVRFAPVDRGAESGVVSVSVLDAPGLELTATLSGSSPALESVTESFVQPELGVTDFLFVIDNSASMMNYQDTLEAAFPFFVDALNEQTVDYHVAVISTDTPTFYGAVVSPLSADPLAEIIAQFPGYSGSGNELGLDMAYAALQPGGDAGPGGDFLRDAATLAIVGITDESQATAAAGADFAAFLWTLKADPENARAHVISGDYPAGCGAASADAGWHEVSVATGGTYSSICATDWSEPFAGFVNESHRNPANFELSNVPVPGTVGVRVDGVAASSGWAYASADNAVKFDEDSVPGPGAQVEVTYDVYPICPD